MSFIATVENDVIKLPEHTHLPNGSTVRIEVVETPRIAPEVSDRLKAASGRATTGLTTDEILRETRGEVVETPRIAPHVAAWLAKISGRATTGLTTDEIMRESRGDA